MKILIIILLSVTGAMAQQQDTLVLRRYNYQFDNLTSKYKPGFVYYDNVVKVTLLRWENAIHKDLRGKYPDHYRWTALHEIGDIKLGEGYVDDVTIDIALGKVAFIKGHYYEIEE